MKESVLGNLVCCLAAKSARRTLLLSRISHSGWYGQDWSHCTYTILYSILCNVYIFINSICLFRIFDNQKISDIHYTLLRSPLPCVTPVVRRCFSSRLPENVGGRRSSASHRAALLAFRRAAGDLSLGRKPRVDHFGRKFDDV